MQNDQPVCFPLLGCWQQVLEGIGRSLLTLVRSRALKPAEVDAVATLARAIQRLPWPTEGISIEASLNQPDELPSRSLFVDMSEDSLAIGYLDMWNSAVGWKYEIRNVLKVDMAGFFTADDDPISVMIELEDWAAEWNHWIQNPEIEFRISYEGQASFWGDSDGFGARWEAVPYGV